MGSHTKPPLHLPFPSTENFIAFGTSCLHQDTPLCVILCALLLPNGVYSPSTHTLKPDLDRYTSRLGEPARAQLSSTAREGGEARGMGVGLAALATGTTAGGEELVKMAQPEEWISLGCCRLAEGTAPPRSFVGYRISSRVSWERLCPIQMAPTRLFPLALADCLHPPLPCPLHISSPAALLHTFSYMNILFRRASTTVVHWRGAGACDGHEGKAGRFGGRVQAAWRGLHRIALSTSARAIAHTPSQHPL